MALWSDLQADVYVYTNRPDLAAETLAALRQAVRTAHKSGKYWRDLVTYNIASIPTNVEIQPVDIISYLPRTRALLSVYPTQQPDLHFKGIDADDLIDNDGYRRVDVYWGIGNTLNIRAAAPVSDYTITYYQWPFMDATTVTSWIVDWYPTLITLWAAATVLGTIGEQEIKQRLETLAALELSDLRSDSIEVVGR